MGLFSKNKPPRPERVPTDTVVPLSFTDDLPLLRAISVHVTCRFDNILDTKVLRLSLERLLQLDGWRRLGARLRLNDNGKLEYHVPVEYDAKRPGAEFTVASYSMGIDDHPLGAKFPQASSQPALVGCPTELLPLCLGPHSPRQIEDWLYSDRPQLAIHVVSFNDATLVTVTWIHTLADIMWLAGFFQAWTAVMSGREEEVPEFQGIGETPLQYLGKDTAGEPYANDRFLLQSLGLLCFALWYIFERIWYPREKERIMCIPERFVEQLRANSLDELKQQNKEGAPFLSESDVLLAWWTRAQTRALDPFPNRLTTLLNVFDVRGIALPESTQSNTAFVTNAVQGSFTFLPTEQIINQPISALASQIRRSLVQHRTKPQVEACYARCKTHSKNILDTPIYGASNGLMLGCSNWNRSRLFDVDFSAAVIMKETRWTDCTHGHGRPSYINPGYLTLGLSSRNTGRIVGKDASGNWWLSYSLRTGAWPAIEEDLKALGATDNK
ncbi:hypothetical protein BDV38DRAFT_278975 [Aspergillus pseudotamarii]|uniref:Transferase family-domain-containing protein n=1 Tax=Aspergillus pseudotamarii TaxID=132259 RepID=A0A5N6T612_ASPPS|nr:uncharacterized protein BDV38DRAFT_278975 [Aspergillus pseudotamarii]KAE8141621.1 hypothetical protein BDV38DRAFT_278975 [Aspergillus pseudotamarii]